MAISICYSCDVLPKNCAILGKVSSGGNTGGIYHGLPPGSPEPRGETDLLTAPLSRLMRLRYNPLFPYMERRIVREIDSIERPGPR